MLSVMGHRENFFKENKGVLGHYRCVRCGRWVTKSELDVDHILPKSKGGSDKAYNLQAMCRHCNRSKQNKTTNTIEDLVKHNAKRAVKGAVKGAFKLFK